MICHLKIPDNPLCIACSGNPDHLLLTACCVRFQRTRAERAELVLRLTRELVPNCELNRKRIDDPDSQVVATLIDEVLLAAEVNHA